MKYLFILGRNISLSKEEVLSYFVRKDISVKDCFLKENGFLVEVDREIEDNAIEDFGGVISIGEVLVEGDIEKNLDKIEVYSGTKNNITYALWDFASQKNHDRVSDVLKERFKSEKLRASEKRFSGRIKLQEGETQSKLKSKLIDVEYFVFEKDKSLFFGKIIQNCDYKEIEKRDMGKPVRREDLAISPRMSKIMINLSRVKKGPVVDAFCGIGTILYESLLQGIPVIGIDKDGKAIVGAKKNLAWGRFDQRKYQLIENDSRKVRISRAEVLISEPDLGKTLKKVPTKEEAKKQVKLFEELMIQSINNLKNSVSGRIVFTAPLILTKDKHKRIGCEKERIAEKTNLKIVEGFPIKEYREGQIVGREVFVLER